MMSFAIPSENQNIWSAIYSCTYVGYRGLLSNKYLYVTLDIMLMPDPMSQKVLWKILSSVVHSIVGTLGSSFLTRKGEASRWSYSDRTMLIILTDSSCGYLVLFLLLWLFFFSAVLSSYMFAFCG
jgi:hypothetical protein